MAKPQSAFESKWYLWGNCKLIYSMKLKVINQPKMKIKHVFAIAFLAVSFGTLAANPVLNDSTKSYSMPFLTKNPQGNVLLSWTEKDAQGINAFCFARSKDSGKTFDDKKIIFSGMGVGNSRLMRAKLLFKKNGSMVAVFSNRADLPGGKRSLEIVFCESKDNGNTWTQPQSVDTDPTKGIVRGFFDAVVLANDEIAVTYLKDVAGSTKHEERDLRLVITKNGVFQPETVIDPVVCDCCNISMLVDAKGRLNVYYRDNNDDVRDMAKMTSTDNGATFSKPEILHTDNWLIKGCPHSGAFSSTFGDENLITWFSGAETEKGLRLTTQNGKRLALINDASAKNAYVTADNKTGVLLWEQTNATSNLSQIAYQKIAVNGTSETVWLKDTDNGTNANGLLVGNKLIVAYEVKQANKRNSIKINTVSL